MLPFEQQVETSFSKRYLKVNREVFIDPEARLVAANGSDVTHGPFLVTGLDAGEESCGQGYWMKSPRNREDSWFRMSDIHAALRAGLIRPFQHDESR